MRTTTRLATHPTSPSEGELLEAPGLFLVNYPPMTIAGFFMLHAMYGLVVGAIYTA